MAKNLVSRRSVLQSGIGIAGLASVGTLASPIAMTGQDSSTPNSSTQNLNVFGSNGASLATGLARAYSFLNTMMDAYAQGATLRLVQSYSDQQGFGSTAFTYDNAVLIDAYLLRSQPGDLSRAEVIGNALVYAQQNNGYGDGRLFQGYFVNTPDANGAYIQPAGAPFLFLGSSTGDTAWAGMALLHLHRSTKNSAYLSAAIKLGNWIYNNAYSSVGSGGYTAGVDASNNKLSYKSTQHNVDVYAFFSMLAHATGSSLWSTNAQSALNFVESMWNSSAGFFWFGTNNDGLTINFSIITEDAQTWSYLALANKAYAASVAWVTANLMTIDTPETINSKLTGNNRVLGETYASVSLRALEPSQPSDQPPDPNSVWLEGSSHAVAALLAQKSYVTAVLLLENIVTAQQVLGTDQTIGGAPLATGQGIVASSSVLNDGFGTSYYPNLHIGATGWFAIAAQLGNPFFVGLRFSG